MWYSGSKCRRIKASVKANYKRLKTDLASGVRKLGPNSVVPKLDKFPLFDEFFLDFNDFWDLDVFLVFGSTHFDPSFDLSPPPTPLTSLAASILALSTLLAASTYDDMIVFSIDVSGTAILLKPLMN